MHLKLSENPSGWRSCRIAQSGRRCGGLARTPKPAHKALPAVGPATSAPVVLSEDREAEIDHCTY